MVLGTPNRPKKVFWSLQTAQKEGVWTPLEEPLGGVWEPLRARSRRAPGTPQKGGPGTPPGGPPKKGGSGPPKKGVSASPSGVFRPGGLFWPPPGGPQRGGLKRSSSTANRGPVLGGVWGALDPPLGGPEFPGAPWENRQILQGGYPETSRFWTPVARGFSRISGFFPYWGPFGHPISWYSSSQALGRPFSGPPDCFPDPSRNPT